MSLLITNATVLTVDAGDRVIDDGAVYVENGRIAAVGPSAELEQAHAGAARVIDGTGKVVLPGFVSTHNHVGYTFFRGRAEDMGLGCVTGQYFPMATVASREERLAVGSLTYAELLKSGVTTTLEMEEEADVFAPFVESLGVRSFMGSDDLRCRRGPRWRRTSIATTRRCARRSSTRPSTSRSPGTARRTDASR